jgi:chemotaxis protein CheX
MFDTAGAGGPPVVGEVRDNLLEPFRAAVCTAVGEMAATEVVAGEVWRMPTGDTLGDAAAVVGLQSATEGPLVLSFPWRTATALARRILAGAWREVDEDLVRDCVGEIANVVAGQAKALLAGTAYHFTFAVPRVVVGAGQQVAPGQGVDCLVAAFRCEQGEFALQLFLKRDA